MAFKPIKIHKGSPPPQTAATGQKAVAAQKNRQEKQTLEEELAFRKGTLAVRDLIAPSSFEVQTSYVRIGSKYARTLFVVGYPRYISVGWIGSIINYSASFDISIYFTPLSTQLVLKQLRNKVGRTEATINAATEKGKPRDPASESALRDMEKLRDDLTLGTEHFFSVGVYMTMYANSLQELDKLTEDMEALFGQTLIYTKRVFYQAEQGFNSTLPLGQDNLEVGFNMNTSPAGTAFPFISSDLTSDNGILYGINRHNNSLILFDRFSMQNANSVVFATSGAGKSVEYDTDVLIKDMQGVRLVKIGEYIDELCERNECVQLDEELEGVILPKLQVYTFDKNLKGEWSNVTVAARKEAPLDIYHFRTKSGREMSVTGDHNMLVLRNGEVVSAKSEDIRKGEWIPIPTKLPEPEKPTISLDLTSLLRDAKGVYVIGAQDIIARMKERVSLCGDDVHDRYFSQYKKGRRIPLSYLLALLEKNKLTLDSESIEGLRLCARHGTGLLPARMPLSNALARILGYIVSEGHIGNRFILITNHDEGVIEDIRECLGELGISCFQRQDRSFVIGSRIFFELIKALGVNGLSADKRVPPFLFQASQGHVREFLRAYFEGDGGVEQHSVTACTLSRGLASDLSYLLFRYGIVARIAGRTKRCTTTDAERRAWILTISGQEHIHAFTEFIGFITERKQRNLDSILKAHGNTNVHVIPVQTVMQELYDLFSSHLRGIQDIIELKNGSYNPSRKKLREVVQMIEESYRSFLMLGDTLSVLQYLPSQESLVLEGVQNKEMNGELWSVLGHTWQLMKRGVTHPYASTVLRVAEVVTGSSYSLSRIKEALRCGFRELNLPLNVWGRGLQAALVREDSDMGYEMLIRASACVREEYDRVAQRLPLIRVCIEKAKTLAYSDLEWDPIHAIQKTEGHHPYVYDLTVDNEVFLAGQGGMYVHNSYTIKLEVLRSMMMGIDVIIIDPEREYQHLCDAVGGTYINISLASESRINPFDLPRAVGEQVSAADIIRSAVITIKGLLRIMLVTISTEEDSILDRALIETYAKKDITPQSDLMHVDPPTMSDLVDVLDGMEGAHSLVEKMKKYTEGTFAGLLNKKTNVEMRNQLVVFSVRDLEDELRPIAIYAIVNYIWNVVRSEMKKRILVIDEAWWLMQHEDSARFIFALVKRCRKYYLGVTTITQDVNDFLNSQYGKAILTNSAIQILLKQSPAAIDTIQKTFLLTEGEKYLLLENGPGEGIFFAGQKHVAIKVVASYSEDQLITTDPRQLLEIEAAKREFAQEKSEQKPQ